MPRISSLTHKQITRKAWLDLQTNLLENIYYPIHCYFKKELESLILKNNKIQTESYTVDSIVYTHPGNYTGFIYKNEKYGSQDLYFTYNNSTLLKFKINEIDPDTYLTTLDPSLKEEFLKFKTELDQTLEEYTKVKRAFVIIFTELTDLDDIKKLLNISIEELPLLNIEYLSQTPQPEKVKKLQEELADELLLIQARLLDNILSTS